MFRRHFHAGGRCVVAHRPAEPARFDYEASAYLRATSCTWHGHDIDDYILAT